MSFNLCDAGEKSKLPSMRKAYLGTYTRHLTCNKRWQWKHEGQLLLPDICAGGNTTAYARWQTALVLEMRDTKTALLVGSFRHVTLNSLSSFESTVGRLPNY